VKGWSLAAAVVVAAVAAVLATVVAAAPAHAQAAAGACKPDPLAGRSLYLRGSFNSWNALETQKFTWACNRWELVTRLSGEHAFKLADEGWSADADFGQGSGRQLLLRGPELKRRFDGMQRFTLRMSQANTPELQVEACPADAPLGSTVLFLRGTPNNWAAQDDYAFQYSCDAYYLNLKVQGRHEFKVADASWTEGSSFGDSADQKANFTADFSGDSTVRVAIVAGRALLSVGPRSFADPTVQAVSDPVALSLRFDSRSPAHKRPFGAVPAATVIDFEVTALPGVDSLTLVVEKRRLEGNQEVLQYSDLARLPMQRSVADGGRERFSASHRFGDVAVHGYWFEAQIGGRLFALQNNTDAVFWTREKGSGGTAAVADKPQAGGTVRRFRQTVFSPGFKVPDWAPDIVYYYVFPDRFRNGNKANDPQPGVTRYRNFGVELHTDWNERPFKPGSGDKGDAHYNNDFFGGDLAGLIEKLDDIRDLGANTIYMTPVFQAGSNHKYDTADYKRIDPAFGTNADFERLTREAARRGIRVIPDTSLNHSGSDSVYFNRYGNHASRGAFQNGRIDPASPYADWYSFKPQETDPERQYRGWVGVPDLPELNKNSQSLRNFFYRDKDAVMKLWLDRGAAGWRMDVAPWVPDDFWREWRAAIKQHSPDALTVAETWFDASKYFLGDMFDSTMNYIFRNAVLEYAAGGKAKSLYGNIELMREAYPPQAFYALMNLLSSHDQARALHQFGWHADKDSDPQDPAVIALAKQRLLLALFFQMTFPGAPTVYYGDEVGVTGGDDPYNRATYPWADLGGKPDLALRAEFKRLIAMRHQHAVLRRGSIDAPLFIDDQVIVWLRRLGGQAALVAVNNAGQARQLVLKLPDDLAAMTWADALESGDIAASGQELRVTVPPIAGKVWLRR
jgi:glycosidase